MRISARIAAFIFVMRSASRFRIPRPIAWIGTSSWNGCRRTAPTGRNIFAGFWMDLTIDQPKAHLPTVCNPTSPTCCDSGLPTHITSHRSESTGSSKTISTSCPRLSLKLPRNLNPSWDLSTIRQGNIFWTPLRVMTRLARFFVTIRLDRRRPWIGELGIDLPLAPVYGLR